MGAHRQTTSPPSRWVIPPRHAVTRVCGVDPAWPVSSSICAILALGSFVVLWFLLQILIGIPVFFWLLYSFAVWVSTAAAMHALRPFESVELDAAALGSVCVAFHRGICCNLGMADEQNMNRRKRQRDKAGGRGRRGRTNSNTSSYEMKHHLG